MTHKITEQLRTLLKAYAERAAKVHADAKPVVDEGGQRRRACGERLQKVVRPALLRFLTELENAGHDASVDRKSTRLNSSHSQISYAGFCLKKKNYCANHGQMTRLRQDAITRIVKV